MYIFEMELTFFLETLGWFTANFVCNSNNIYGLLASVTWNKISFISLNAQCTLVKESTEGGSVAAIL